ncbi:hypothetical protein [Clostridium paraputrificum]|uniref:hypothetical protein n=1 Tax=Clostridium paraputrificum TaxID=29363 RepID=UPI0006C4B548|nr:hypothetical protein [Clostridium paraputrificum]CUO84401.1 Uncharacterised protein [Clostridium paraputrificum]
MRAVPQDVKELVFLVTEEVVQKENDVNMAEIIRTLEEEHNIKFFNLSVLQQLVNEALNNIVYIDITE